MIKTTSIRAAVQLRESGIALLAALITLAILTTVAASVFLASVPAYRGTYQASAWQQAKLAADAGVDYAMAQLQKSCPKTNLYTWPGWTQTDGTTAVTAGSNGIRISSPSDIVLAGSGDGNSNARLARVEVDVLTRDTNDMHNPWYRIRATGMADVQSSQLSVDKRDLFLRRMTLNPTSGARPHISRTVEVIARPVYLWEYALKTKGVMQLGGGNTWVIDSYDSRYPLNGLDPFGNVVTDPRSSTISIYDPLYARAFGNIASDLTRPDSSPYGMLIDAAGAVVRGEVQTNGGDDPNTTVHENVYQSTGIDQNRITDEFYEKLTPQPPPAWALSNSAMLKLTSESTVTVPSAGSTDPNSPYTVSMNTNGSHAQGQITIPNPDPIPATGKAVDHYVDIYVNADIDLNGATIDVAPGMHVNLYLNGNLNFRNMDINYNSPNDKGIVSGQIPGNLLIYGVKNWDNPTATPAPLCESSGNGHIVAAFYGPQYTGNLDGNTEIMGSFVLDTYHISGGGGSGGDSLGAGFHYDEALGVAGPVKYYKSVSYFEDTRKDLE